MATALFRAQAIEARRQRLAGTVVAAVPPSSRLYTRIAGGLALVILLTLIFGRYASTANVRGIVAYDAGVARVSAASPGEVTQIHVKAGTHVEAGTPLVTVSTAQGPNGLSAQLAEIDAQLREVDRQIVVASATNTADAQALSQDRASLSQTVSSLSRQQAILASQIGITESILARNTRLAKAGAGSQRQVDEARAALLSRRSESESVTERLIETRNKIASIGIQLGQRGLDGAKSASQLRAQRAMLIAQRADVSRADHVVVTAPVAGEVSDLTTEVGQRIVPEKSLATIVPQGSAIETWLYAPSSAIGFVRPGQQVRLRFDAFPYQKYGVGKGTVVAISRVAIDPANVDAAIRPAEPVFRIRVRIDSMGSLAQQRDALRPGMTLAADLIMQSRPLWALLFGAVIR